MRPRTRSFETFLAPDGFGAGAGGSHAAFGADPSAYQQGGQSGPDVDFGLLDADRSDVASLARFSQRLDYAVFHLCAVFDTAADAPALQPPSRPRGAAKSWTATLAHQCISRWHVTRRALTLDWPRSETTEPLYRAAFWSLCELTPADSQLRLLFERDRERACRELVRHVDIVADQLALASELAEELARDDATSHAAEGRARLDAVRESLLDRAGERLSLTQGAERLCISRQGLHKKIKAGTALGLVVGETLVVPSIQFVASDDDVRVVAHLKDVLSLFTGSGAGLWSALQFLIEPDPTLGAVPLDILKAGKTAPVVAAARAYLGVDDG